MEQENVELLEQEIWTVVKQKRPEKSRKGKKFSFEDRRLTENSKLKQKILKQQLIQGDSDTIERELSRQQEDEILIEALTSLQDCVKNLWTVGSENFFTDCFKGCTESGACGFTNKIICLGIGNFLKPYSSPMIQLACALILRRLLSRAEYGDQSDNVLLDKEKKWSQLAKYALDMNSFYSTDIEISFYDPCTTKLEKSILENNLGIKVEKVNCKGKHIVQPNDKTVFFMPHCPMRLYSNLLWANWDKRVIQGGNIVVIGNSLISYNDAVFCRDKRHDETNGIFRIVPFIREIPLKFPAQPKRHGTFHKKFYAGLMRAFNDCSLTTFHETNCSWPEKPKEFPDDDVLDSELR